MKWYCFAMLVCALTTCRLSAQANSPRGEIDNHANYTFNVNGDDGLFQFLQPGTKSRMVLKNNTILIPSLPNVGNQIQLDGFSTFKHFRENDALFFNYSRSKIGNRINMDGFVLGKNDFPFMMSLNNYLLMNRLLMPSVIVPTDHQMNYKLSEQKPNIKSSIDIPLIYSPDENYFLGISTKSGLSMRGVINKRFSYEQTGRILFFTRNIDNFFLENSGTFMWNVQESLRIKAGYVFSWGKNPYSDYLQFWPTLDILIVDFK